MSKKAQDEFKKLSKMFAKVAAKESAIKAEKEELATQMKAALKGLGVDKVETTEGTFTMYKTTKWMFSEKVGAKEAEVEALKAVEKETGIATANFTESMRFTPVKAKE
jgi:hypothetical protein